MISKRVSVVIPTRNGAPEIQACLESLRRQTIRPFEVLVVDSGSTDGTLEIVRSFSEVTLLEIPPEQFNHGATRNLGIRIVHGDFVILTVQDARAADEQWIERLIGGFTDERVAGVCGLQTVPQEGGTNPVDWFRPRSEPHPRRFEFASPEAFDVLTPDERRAICGWDNVTAAYRRSALLDLPFAQTSFSEDALWARDALRAGKAIVYEPRARVYHHHFEDASFVFRRMLTTAYHEYRHFGLNPSVPPLARSLASIARTLLRETRIGWTARARWFAFNAKRLTAARRAIGQMKTALRDGDDALDRLHKRYCGLPPQPQKAP